MNNEDEPVITLNRWKSLNKQPCVMLFDLGASSGHHSSYLNYLIKYWCTEEPLKQLVVVTSPNFFKKNIVADEFANYCKQQNIWFVEISSDEYLKFNNKKRFSRGIYEWSIYCKYASALEASHCLLMYFDSLQLPIIFGQKSPCYFSGIYFRPSFHYCEFDGYSSSLSNSIRQWAKKKVLYLAMKNSQLRILFCLDQFATKHIETNNAQVKTTYLPDPVDEKDKRNSDELKNCLQVEPGRIVFLLFGSLEERKGVLQVLQAIDLLPPSYCRKICLVLAGVKHFSAPSTQKFVEQLPERLPIQIITRYEFISDHEVSAYFQLADVVLAPYQRHVGMSGVILHAAAAQKPVISSSYGLLGKIVKDNHLGITTDTAFPSKISKVMAEFVDKGSSTMFNPKCSASFAEQHNFRYFSKILTDEINMCL
jgi:glycosyltransferase involved in cell wall biosynthesis